MDYMDIDHVEVPDTPDRLIARNINGRGCVENEIGSSVPTHSGCTELLDEGARNQLSNRSKQATDNGLSRRLPYSLPGKSLSISKKPECDGDFTPSLGNSSSSRNTYLFRRRVSDKSANHGEECFLDSHLKEKGNSLCASQPSILGESAVVDLTEQHGTFHTFQNPSSDRASEDRYTRGIRRGATSTHGFPSLNHRGKCPIATHAAFKGKEKIDDACKGGLVVDHGKGIYGDSQPKPGKSISASFRSIPFPRASGQKRLVRNGCISPHNIAKAKQLAEDQSNGSVDVQNDKEPAVSECSSSVIRDLIAEDNTSLKGQAGRSYLFSSKEACTNTISTRPFSSHGEDGRGNSNSNGDAFRHFEGLSGWRNTRNRTERVNFPLSHDDDHLPQTKDDSCFLNQPIGKRVMERQNGGGSSSRISNDKDKDHNAASFWSGSTPPVSQPVSVPISHSQVNGRRTSTLLKRQKQGSASSSNGESSKLTSVDSDLVFLGSSGEPRNPQSNRTQRGHGIGNLDPIIEIDALSPEMQHGLPHNTGCINNDDTDARSRQIEADEMLARELQEQLYNEVPGVGDGEIDARIELALHQADTSRHAFSGRSPPVFHPRDSVFSNLYRQSQSRTSQNPTARRGIQARGPTSSRLTRMRNRLPSQSARSSLSYRERSSLFPPNMDVDMRIHILEALEAFSDMEMVGNFLQDDREFNENDYEMLLALDENNHRHGGASLDQINILPQSIVQGDNFEEACAICLDTPSSGDTIRHLPCLHKFHKDCIDPWLRRRTSCPVCKSSIT